jgi:hypothetical protein
MEWEWELGKLWFLIPELQIQTAKYYGLSYYGL